MNVIYTYCGAHKALMFALYVKSSGKDITVITSNKDVIKYCQKENINFIELKDTQLTAKYLYKVFGFKKRLDKVIKKIDFKKNDEFLLLGTATNAIDSFYLAKELSKKGIVYYKNPDMVLEKYRLPFFIRGAMRRFVLKLVLGLDLIYYNSHNAPRLGVDEKFLKKYNIKEYAAGTPPEKMIFDLIKNYKSSFNDYDNFIIDSSLLQGYVKFDSMLKFHENLFKLPVKFAFKKHPGLTEEEMGSKSYITFYEKFKSVEEIPNYVPVELLFNNVKKNVMSICSVALITASKFNHLKAISFIELLEWDDIPTKKQYKDYLKKESKNKILFPNNFEELKKILLS